MALIDTKDIEFSYKLDEFQTKAMQCIDNNINPFVVAKTGNGKSSVAEYAIAKAIKENKKVIYTTPLKTLSNQKYCDINKKIKSKFFKDITTNDLGILTGDSKRNDDNAQIMIATTEIVQNKLFMEPQFFNDVGYVIFDEVHYFTDEFRGHVWENTMILLPNHIIMVMLSATVENVPNFINWLDSIRTYKTQLCSTDTRIVPLAYSLYHANWNWNAYFYNTKFEDNNIRKNKYMENYTDLKKQITSGKYNHKYAINQVINFMENKNMFPTIIYAFSRQKCENMPSYVEKSYIDHKERAEIEKIFNHYMMKAKLSEEDKNANQFVLMKKYLLKGIAYHTSGVIPYLKEIIEIMLDKKLIKILFATETVATGLNIGFKSVVFTELRKYDSSCNRLLTTSEFLQASGRAGRRGHDEIGHVIYAPMHYIENMHTFESMLFGQCTNLVSSFKINIPLILKSISNENINIDTIIAKSYMNYNNMDEVKSLKLIIEFSEKILIQYNKYIEKTNEHEQALIQFNDILKNLMNNYTNIATQLENYKTKKIINDIYNIIMNIDWHKIKESLQSTDSISKIQDIKFPNEICELFIEKSQKEITNLEYNINLDKYTNILYLQKLGYVDDKVQLSTNGHMASFINETSPVVLLTLYNEGIFNDCDEYALVCIFSLFLNCNANSKKNNDIKIDDLKIEPAIIDKIKKVKEIVDTQINNVDEYFQYDIDATFVEYTYLWAYDYSIGEVYGHILDNYVFEGNFVKNMLKLNNIINEFIKAVELVDNHELSNKLSKCKALIIKNIVALESLYLHM